MDEVWLPAYGYEDRFEVSNLGDVRRATTRQPVRLSLSDGYLRLWLGGPVAPRYVLVHRLIAHTFLPETRDVPLIRHLNDVSTDNRLSNLAGGDNSANQQDAINNGRRTGLAWATQRALIEDFRARDMGVAALAEKYGVPRKSVVSVIYRQLGRQKPTAEELLLREQSIVSDSRAMTDRAVAEKYGVSVRTVINYRRKAGVKKLRGRPQRLISLTSATDMC